MDGKTHRYETALRERLIGYDDLLREVVPVLDRLHVPIDPLDLVVAFPMIGAEVGRLGPEHRTYVIDQIGEVMDMYGPH